MRFIKTVQKAGLYVHLRIGPYVCAEWNFGYFYFPFRFLSFLNLVCFFFEILFVFYGFLLIFV